MEEGQAGIGGLLYTFELLLLYILYVYGYFTLYNLYKPAFLQGSYPIYSYRERYTSI